MVMKPKITLKVAQAIDNEGASFSEASLGRSDAQLFGGARHYVFHLVWGCGGDLGGRGALPADNTPAQRKNP